MPVQCHKDWEAWAQYQARLHGDGPDVDFWRILARTRVQSSFILDGFLQEPAGWTEPLYHAWFVGVPADRPTGPLRQDRFRQDRSVVRRIEEIFGFVQRLLRQGPLPADRSGTKAEVQEAWAMLRAVFRGETSGLPERAYQILVASLAFSFALPQRSGAGGRTPEDLCA